MTHNDQADRQLVSLNKIEALRTDLHSIHSPRLQIMPPRAIREPFAETLRPFNDTAMDILLARAAVRGKTEAVFVNGAGHPREARNLLRAFYPAMRKAGISGSASMTSVTPLRPDSSRRASMSIRCRSWAAGKRSRWCCAMRTISRRVCAGVQRCWTDCGEKLAQS